MANERIAALSSDQVEKAVRSAASKAGYCRTISDLICAQDEVKTVTPESWQAIKVCLQGHLGDLQSLLEHLAEGSVHVH